MEIARFLPLEKTVKTRKPMTFAEIPDWAIDADERSRYTIASAFELAGLTDEWVRLTAETQRALFGFVLFGKCNLKVDANGIKVSRSVCFGTDFSTTTFDWNDVERCMAGGYRPVL